MKLGNVTTPTPLRGRFVVPTLGGSVLYVGTKFEVDRSFRSKVIRGSRNFYIGSRDPGHAHFGVALFSIRRRVRHPSLYQIRSGLVNSFKSY